MAGLTHKLEARQSQGLVMTPQLQQAIKLLQLNAQELSAYIEAELERNPLLERDDREDDGPAEAPAEIDPAQDALDVDERALYDDSPADLAGASAGAASDWARAGGGGAMEGEDYDAAAQASREKTLYEHLHGQLAELGLSQAERLIGAHLIDLADEDGYLRIDFAETAARLGVARSALTGVLERLQTFEPAGVMARNLAECLALQLRERNRLDPAMGALLANLERLAAHDYAGLRALCGVDQDDLAEMIAEVRALTPKPGLGFGVDPARLAVPDVFIRQGSHGAWTVELNTEALPRLLVNRRYAAEIKNARGSEADKLYIAECAQNASWLVKSLDQRARTILKVASEIVRHQDAFFAKGVAWLRPLNLKTIAEAVGMHESTVSRVTSNKYAATPRGVFELRYFFSAAIASADGGEAYSAAAVRYRIKTLIDAETAETVLSDDKIVERLRAEGVDIARRTVAKYREAMNIPSSVRRRRAHLQAV